MEPSLFGCGFFIGKNMERGWIKIHRKMTEWEWFTDHITFVVFMSLLMTVNFEDKKWRGVEVKRGQRIIGLSKFAEEVGITLQQLRTSLKKLESTGDINKETTNKFTIVSVVKFDTYQSAVLASNTQTTNEQQSNNIQATNEQQQLKNERTKELKKQPETSLPDFISSESMSAFQEMRKKIKKPMTNRAIELLIGKLEKFNAEGHDVNEMLDNSTMNCWQGVFEPKDKKSNVDESLQVDKEELHRRLEHQKAMDIERAKL